MARKGSSAARQPEEQALVITRVFDAPRETVFRAWTEPERMKRWWGPKNFTTPVIRIDPRPGGAYLYCMRSPEGKDYWGKGTYLEVEEPERIVCTDSFADENGNPVSPQDYGMSPDWPEEAVIAVTFDRSGGRTRFTLNHSPLPPGPERDMCRQGWNESLDRLEEYLAKG
ncbi:MAG TPA: SRPBCC domain-containing protein [Candidatus Aquicultoraceae bacterium]|nr:SRPBCC domain-containing protein [Candidatus Aquicultoraceae bacterium]